MQRTANRPGPGIDPRKAPEPALGDDPITGDRYYSREFAEREFEKVWTRVWLIAGLERQLEEPGDYLTCELGRESVLCVRGRDRRIRAFYNVCQHRGNLLVHNEGGHIDEHFACSYHGWKYDTA
ncbi:MAG: Rieske (2Fe-2S) protein, partial [Myxococcota bacterium]